jgi:hypothetical protein
MKTLAAWFAVALATASIPYFTYMRELSGATANKQAYVVVDQAVWAHARRDLGDLRLYAADAEIPYALEVERGGAETQQQEVKILQPAAVQTHGSVATQFLLDMFGLSQYDHVQLQISAHDFIAETRVEGANDARAASWALLRSMVVYDLTSDNLGSNTTLRLPLSTYRFLRVTVNSPIRPADVTGATASSIAEEKAAWRTISAPMQQEQRARETVLSFSPPKGVPLDRVQFSIDAGQPNFRRSVEIRGDDNQWLGGAELARIHLVRHGQKIDSDETSIELGGSPAQSLKIIIQNGDDRPLKITAAQLQQWERRLYFQAPGTPSAALRLYYGDEKLESPVYDYTKLFVKDAAAAPVTLGAEQNNPGFQPRPDERPWSERHPAVLWIAIIVAVLLLGAIALRSMKSAPPPAGNAAQNAARK